MPSWSILQPIAWASDTDKIFVVKLPPQRPIVLENGAVDVWLAITEGLDPFTSIAAAYELPEAQLHDDILAVLNNLQAQGILQQNP